MFKTDKKVQKKRPPFAISLFFHNKGFDHINLSSMLHLNNVKNLFADQLKIDEPPSLVYSLGKTTRNKILNYKDTVSFIDTNDDTTYITGIVEYDCQQHKIFFDENHGHVLTVDLKILTNSELRKLVSKDPNFCEAMSLNWNNCKREIEIGLDSSIERIISTNPKVITEEFVEWKKNILQEVVKKIISLKHRIKFHKINHLLKQDVVNEYLNELHENVLDLQIT